MKKELVLLSRWIVLGVFAVVAIGCLMARLYAIEDPNIRMTSGPIGVVHTQTARLNALCSSRMPGPCIVNFMYTDPNQHVLKHASITLMPGHAGYVDLPVDASLLGDQRRRIELLPFLEFGRNSKVIGSVEVFDTLSGKTETFTNVLYTDPNQ